MKLLKRKILIMITFMIIATLLSNLQNNFYSSSTSAISNPPIVGVLLANFNDPYMYSVKQSLENIEKEDPGKVKFSFYDSKDNQSMQNETIATLINSNIDLLLVNLVDPGSSNVYQVIGSASAKDIPVIFFNIELPIDAKSIPKRVVVIGTDTESSGILQGKILVDLWNNNKGIIDKNQDNKLQYIMLQGKTNNEGAINRTKYSISNLNANGIKTEQLALVGCNWDKNCAKEAINSLLLKYGNNIEAIISNNDAMAVGAVEALQVFGYNKGDKTRTIPVVGVDAIQEARELISKGFMAGTVVQDPKELATALYSIGLNLAYKRDPLEGTNYKFDNKGVVRMPYYEYKP